VNPTLTIIANAMRVAEVVANRLGTTTLGETLPAPRLPVETPAPAPS
jgi:hypothetical protein